VARLTQIRASRGHDFLIGSAKRLLGIDAQSPGQPHPRLESTSDQLDPLLSRTGREGLVRIPVDPRLQTRAEIAKAELDLGELQEGMPQAFGVALGARLEPPRDLGRAGQGRQAPRNARKGVGSSPRGPPRSHSLSALDPFPVGALRLDRRRSLGVGKDVRMPPHELVDDRLDHPPEIESPLLLRDARLKDHLEEDS